MKFKTIVFSLLIGLFSTLVMAGTGHDHGHSHTPVDRTTAMTKATEVVVALVKKNKLEQSWASIMASSVEKRKFKGNPEWLAVFVNEDIADRDKRRLYVFLTLGGDYIAANFSGN